MLALTVVWESTYRVLMHSASCYRAVAIVLPVVLIGFAAVSRQRWACTIVAAIYMGYAMFMLWLFPLFPATPKLGPVYQHITHMVPMEFPAADDRARAGAGLGSSAHRRVGTSGRRPRCIGVLCLASLLAVQWPFASFLISPASANWFFGTKYFAYFARPNGFDVRHLFFPAESHH